jgi:hypothetical protein
LSRLTAVFRGSSSVCRDNGDTPVNPAQKRKIGNKCQQVQRCNRSRTKKTRRDTYSQRRQTLFEDALLRLALAAHVPYWQS